MDSAWILYFPVKCWLLLQFFLHLCFSKSLLPRQQFALKIKNLIISYVFFIFIKLDWNQAAGSTVIGRRDSKSHRQTDYVHSVYIRKNNKITFYQFGSWNYNHSVTLQHSFHWFSLPSSWVFWPLSSNSLIHSCNSFSLFLPLLFSWEFLSYPFLPEGSYPSRVASALQLQSRKESNRNFALKWVACLNTSNTFSRNTFPSPLVYIHLVLLIVHLYSEQLPRHTHFH